MMESLHQNADSRAPQPSHPEAPVSSMRGTTATNPSNQNRPASATRSVDKRKTSSDITSDEATAAFIRRVLCTHDVLLGNGEKGHTTLRPIKDVLPPLTSSNDVDLQLYAIISVIIRDFVQAWYSKITPDQIFVSEVILIIAHCTRALEERLQGVDFEALLFDEIPELIQAHLSSYRLATGKSRPTGSLAPDPRVVYHTLHPHPALSPVPSDEVPGTVVEQRESESAWRQLLVQGLLAILLPTEHLKNGCLRALVAEIFAEMILGNSVSGKACEGWLLWECITKIAELPHTDGKPQEPPSTENQFEQSLPRLERFGLLATHKDPGHRPRKPLMTTGWRHHFLLVTMSVLFWSIVQYAFLTFTAVRAVVSGLLNTASLPSRFVASEQSYAEGQGQSHLPPMDTKTKDRNSRFKRPILSMKLWSCAAQLTDLNLRMPWLLGFISMLHNGALTGPGKVGETDGVLDRLISHTIHTRMLNPALVPVILRTLRTTVFPNNSLGPPRQVPTEEEAKSIKSGCAVSLLALLPAQVASVFFATSQREIQLEHIEETLSCFEDSYLNKHLIYQVVELMIIRLVPELGSHGVEELYRQHMI